MILSALVIWANMMCGDLWCEGRFYWAFYEDRGRMLVVRLPHSPFKGIPYARYCDAKTKEQVNRCVEVMEKP